MATELFVDASAWYPLLVRGVHQHDAVSFAVMAERGISEALTLDRHFGVAGFRMVPG